MDIEVLKDRSRILNNAAKLLWKASHPGQDASAVIESVELISAIAATLDQQIADAEKPAEEVPSKPKRSRKSKK